MVAELAFRMKLPGIHDVDVSALYPIDEEVTATFYTPGAYALTHSQDVRRSRAVHACGALRLVGGCTWHHSNVGGVTAGQAPHNSSNVGGVTAGQVGHNSSNVGVVTAGQVGHNSSNVGVVTAGQAPHNSSNVGVVTAGQVGHNSSACNEGKNI